MQPYFLYQATTEPVLLIPRDEVLDDSWFLPQPNLPVLDRPGPHPSFGVLSFQVDPSLFVVVDPILDDTWFLPQANLPVRDRARPHPSLGGVSFQGEPSDFVVIDPILDDAWFLPPANQPVLPRAFVHPGLWNITEPVKLQPFIDVLGDGNFLPLPNQPVLPRASIHPGLPWNIFQGDPADFTVPPEVLDTSWFLPLPNQPVLPLSRIHPGLTWSVIQVFDALFTVADISALLGHVNFIVGDPGEEDLYYRSQQTLISFGALTGLGAALTMGTVTGYITKDDGAQAALANSVTHKGNGQWQVTLTSEEMNAEVIGLAFIPSSGVPVYMTINTKGCK